MQTEAIFRDTPVASGNTVETTSRSGAVEAAPAEMAPVDFTDHIAAETRDYLDTGTIGHIVDTVI